MGVYIEDTVEKLGGGLGRTGGFREVEFEVSARQDTQSNFKRTSEMVVCVYNWSIYLQVVSTVITRSCRSCEGMGLPKRKGKMRRGGPRKQQEEVTW